MLKKILDKIEATQIIDRMKSVDNVKSELQKNITVPKEKKKSYAEIVRGTSPEITRT